MGNPILVNVVNIAAYTPAETIELVSRAGVKKGNMRPDKVFLSAVSAGCLLSFGCAVSLSAYTAPWFQENAPGLIRMIGALVFPLGLVMVVLTGADLFTATTMVGRKDIHTGTLRLTVRISTQQYLSSTAGYRSGRCCSTGSCASGAILLAPSLSWPSYSDVRTPNVF